MSATLFHIEEGDGPLIGAAVHDGHAVRDEVAAIMGLSEPQRLREEDPFTGEWTAVAGTRILGLNSRFEVDLNRPRDKAVYLRPEDAWGLEVWSREPGPDVVERSLARYDAFYTAVDDLLERVLARHGGFVLYDLHTYNHRRDGPGGPTADPAGNPEVNIGTGTLDRGRWGAVVDRFVTGLSAFDFLGRRLDVRENVKFSGGNFPRHVNQRFGDRGVAIAIEFKKFFMDEWTGARDEATSDAIQAALRATVPGVLETAAVTPPSGARRG